MCLVSQNIKPLVSNKDIVTFKVLEKSCAKNGYVTPFRETAVSLNEVMKANNDVIELTDDYLHNVIEGGAIHSCIAVPHIVEILEAGRIIVKCIIKAGTPFYVGFNFTDIASTELFITDEIISEVNDCEEILKETRQELYNLVREETAKEYKDNVVKIGDILLSDRKTFVSPDNLNSNMMPIGIVSFFYADGKPHITALNQKRCTWGNCSKPVNVVGTRKEAYDNFDGYNNTKRFVEKHKNDLKQFESFMYCNDYKTEGTESGDWFFPSAGEVLHTCRYLYMVNVAIAKIRELFPNMDVQDFIYGTNYWDSAEISQTNAWYCRTNNAYVYYYNSKWGSGYVRPSLALDVAQA